MADASSVAYDALKMAVEHVLAKIREGKKWEATAKRGDLTTLSLLFAARYRPRAAHAEAALR